jgi:uncharacterized membrane protein
MHEEEHLELMLGRLLRIGVTIAAATVAAGAIWFLARHGQELPDYHRFHENADNSPGLRAVLDGIAAGRSRSLIQAGLLLLIATPVARVAFSLIAFARARDYMYVAVTAIVLSVLMFSLTAGV